MVYPLPLEDPLVLEEYMRLTARGVVSEMEADVDFDAYLWAGQNNIETDNPREIYKLYWEQKHGIA